jgi:hypothetical protein
MKGKGLFMSKNKFKAMLCTQCGGNELQREGDRLRCAYCDSVFEIEPEEKNDREPRLLIRKGANLIVGKNASLIVRGDVQIEPGANVRLEGRLKLVKKGDKVSGKSS